VIAMTMDRLLHMNYGEKYLAMMMSKVLETIRLNENHLISMVDAHSEHMYTLTFSADDILQTQLVQGMCNLYRMQLRYILHHCKL